MKLQGGEKEKMMYDENPISDKVRFIDNKIYTPADTTKIEKAIDLMTELENVTKSNLDTSTKQIKIMELQNQIKQTGFKLSLDELKQLETLLDRRQRDIVLQKEKNLELKSERLIQKAVTDEIINQTKYYTQMTEVEKNRIKDMVANTALVKDMQAKWKAQDGRNVFFGNNYTKFYANYVQKRIDAEEKQKQEDEEKKKKKDEEEKVQKQKEASLKNFKSSVKNSTLDFFKGNFNTGLKNQTNTFNDTFSNIAARTGTTENGYLTAQGGLNTVLSYRGLDDNIKASDIMKTWNTLATNGINVDLNTDKGRAEATSRAIELAINKTVVPYLDTNSSNFQQLVDFYPSLQMQIRGIGRATTEISGSSVYANKYLQDMINSLSPMSKLAETQIGIQYAKTIGTYESLRSQGISELAIGDYYAMAKSIQNDPSKALTSGNLTQRLATANLIASGADLKDISQVNAANLRSGKFLSGLVPGGNLDSLYAGALNLGGNVSSILEIKGANIEDALRKGSKTGALASIKGKGIVDDFSKGNLQTAKTKQETALENMTTQFAIMGERLGAIGNLVDKGLKDIITLLKTQIGGNLLSFFGKNGTMSNAVEKGAKASSGLLGTVASGITIGAFTSVAAVGIASIITASRHQDDQLAIKNNRSSTLDTLKGTAFENDTGRADVLNYVKSTGSVDNPNSGTFWSNFGSNLAGGVNQLVAWTNVFNKQKDPTKYNAENWRNFISTRRGVFDSKELQTLVYVYAMALRHLGQWQVVSQLFGSLSEDSIVNWMNSYAKQGKIAELMTAVNWASNVMTSMNLKPVDVNGNEFNGDIGFNHWTEGQGFAKYHRQGLDSVPYDEYPAMLHKDEAVLTSDTAGQLRRLIGVYRETQNQAVSFDAIIQNQTNILVDKLNQVIDVLRTGNIPDINPDDRITDRMRSLKSTYALI